MIGTKTTFRHITKYKRVRKEEKRVKAVHEQKMIIKYIHPYRN